MERINGIQKSILHDKEKLLFIVVVVASIATGAALSAAIHYRFWLFSITLIMKLDCRMTVLDTVRACMCVDININITCVQLPNGQY